MARLEYGDLPEDIRKMYKNKEIHKIAKPNATIISIFLKSHDKINWRKKGQHWELLNPEDDNSNN